MKSRNVLSERRCACAAAFAVILQHTLLKAQVPLINFEQPNYTAEEVSASAGQIGQYAGWSVRFGKASITNQAWRAATTAQTSGQCLRLTGGSAPAVEVERGVTVPLDAGIAYVDFWMKPAAECGNVALSGLEVNGAHLAFVRAGSPADALFTTLSGNSSAVVGSNTASNQGWGVLYVLDGGDDGQPKMWRRLPCRYRLGKDGRIAMDWMRLTLRQTLSPQPGGSWDLYVDASMVAANLGYEDRGESFTGSFFFGSESTSDVLIDDLQVTLTNPLIANGGQSWTADIDEDGMDDAWETAQSGQQPWSVDRDGIANSEGKSWLQLCVEAGATRFAQVHGPDGLDSDADGMPDYWEDMFGLDKNDAADAAIDADGDGKDCLTEFHLGTTPISPPLYEGKTIGQTSSLPMNASVTALDAVSVAGVSGTQQGTWLRAVTLEKSTGGAVSLVRNSQFTNALTGGGAGINRWTIDPPAGLTLLSVSKAFINSTGAIAGSAVFRHTGLNDVRSWGFVVAAESTTAIIFNGPLNNNGNPSWTWSAVHGLNDSGQLLLNTVDYFGVNAWWRFDPAAASPYGALPSTVAGNLTGLRPDGTVAVNGYVSGQGHRPQLYTPGISPRSIFPSVVYSSLSPWQPLASHSGILAGKWGRCTFSDKLRGGAARHHGGGEMGEKGKWGKGGKRGRCACSDKLRGGAARHHVINASENSRRGLRAMRRQ